MTAALLTRQVPTRATQLRRLRAAVARCHELIIHSHDQPTLLVQVCDELMASGALQAAWVAWCSPTWNGPHRHTPQADEHQPHPTLGSADLELAKASGQAVWPSVPSEPLGSDSKAQLSASQPGASTNNPTTSVALLPITIRGQTVAVLAVQAATPGTWTASSRLLLLKLTHSLGVSWESGTAANEAASQQAAASAEATATLGHEHQLMQAFVDLLPGSVFMKDENLRLVMLNQELARNLGRDRSDLIGATNAQLFPPEFAQAASELDHAVLRSGVTQVVTQTLQDQAWETRLFLVTHPTGKKFLGGISLDVTEHWLNTARTQALLDLHGMASQLDERALLTQGLEMAENLTRSDIGFLHFVNEDQETLELVTWTAGALRGCTAAHDSHYPISAAGIWADCFRQREPVVVNDYASFPDKKGLPAGHATLNRFISIPVIEGTRVWMMLGVGNKQTDYTDTDVQTLQLLGNDLWRMAQRRREEKLRQQRVADLEAANARLANMQLQLLQSEKLASIGQLAAGVAHEINNPIGFLKSNLHTLAGYVGDLLSVIQRFDAAQARLGPAHSDAFLEVTTLKAQVDHAYLVTELPSLIGESQDGIERVRRIVQDLKSFSRSGDTEWDWADLTHGIETTINIAWNQIKYKATLEREFQALPQVYCVASQINQVVMNLLVNAGQAIEAHGTITLRTGHDDTQVWVEVQDTGCGMTPDQLKHIYEPFFTTKPPGQGTGLGLAIAWQIVERHQGRMEVESTPGQGSRFRLYLPIDGHAAAAAAQSQPSAT